MTLETHNWSSSTHQELHKIVKDEIFPIVNQVDARVQNFKIQFLKEAAKFVGDFKSLTKEDDESLAKYKALELEIKRLLRAVVSQDIMSIVQKESVVDTSNLQTELECMKERFENCIIKKENEYAKLWNNCHFKLHPHTTRIKSCKNDKVIAPGMFRINPFKTSREAKHVPNNVRASARTKPINVSQPPVISKKYVISDSNGLSSTGIDNTKTKRPIIPICYDDDDDEESSTPLRDIIILELPPCIAITPVLSTKDSLIMGDEHLDTIPEKGSDEFIKSSVDNLFPNPSASEIERHSEGNLSNPLFDEEIISMKIDMCHFNAEFDLIESLLNQDSSIISSSKIDSLLDEFKLLCDNLSLRPPEEINSENSDVVINSFSPCPIPVEDSDPFMEEIDLCLTSDGSMPLGIDSDYSDTKEDNLFLEILLHDDLIPLSGILDFSNMV
uniref:Reverse transcriptase domain-containing protein n=1 Tax=Tanacetum cinerariifolium TaxID=118510 RepID=A0A699HMR3_TANCI|nr:hypothetical protein [Tanacetum cinerariifolium]